MCGMGGFGWGGWAALTWASLGDIIWAGLAAIARLALLRGLAPLVGHVSLHSEPCAIARLGLIIRHIWRHARLGRDKAGLRLNEGVKGRGATTLACASLADMIRTSLALLRDLGRIETLQGRTQG